jgi:hypothetical protein
MVADTTDRRITLQLVEFRRQPVFLVLLFVYNSVYPGSYFDYREIVSRKNDTSKTPAIGSSTRADDPQWTQVNRS